MSDFKQLLIHGMLRGMALLLAVQLDGVGWETSAVRYKRLDANDIRVSG